MLPYLAPHCVNLKPVRVVQFSNEEILGARYYSHGALPAGCGGGGGGGMCGHVATACM